MADFAQKRSARSGAGENEGITWKSIPAGAATQVWAATSADLSDHNGAYLADCGVGVLNGNPGTNGFMPYLLDDERAGALWELSERLVGVPFAL